MGLEVIPNQPINLEPYVADDCNVGDGKQYCQLYNVGDSIYCQWKLTPCGDDLVCDPELDYLLSGNNFISNGTFTGNATGWTLSGFSYSANSITASTGSAAYAEQTIYDLVHLAYYTLTYTVSGVSNTDLSVRLGSGHYYTMTSTNGTHTVQVRAIIGGGTSGVLSIQATEGTPGAGVTITLDSISMDTATANTCITYDTGYYSGGWQIASGSLFHTAGTSDTIQVGITLLSFTDYQQIKVEIVDYESGALSVFAGTEALIFTDADGNQSYNISGNGIFTFYASQTASFDLSIVSTVDFEGGVGTINVYELNKNFSAALTDVDGTYVQDVTSDISYGFDRANLVIDSTPLEGCYKIAVLDSCATFGGGTGTEINSDSSFASSSGWTLTASGTGTTQVTGGQLVMVLSNVNPSLHSATRAYTFPDGDTLYSYQITISMGASTDAGADIFLILPAADGAAVQYIPVVTNPIANTTYVVTGIATVSNGTTGTYHNKMGLYNSDGGSAASSTIVNSFSVILSTVPDEDNSYLSNCISVNTEHQCAKLIEGTNSIAYQDYLGFNFQGGNFRISARARFLKFNPTYPIDGTDYEYTDGSRRSQMARREKYYEGLIDHVDETTHDWISTAMLCDYFTIAGERYYARLEDYKPEWDKSGNQQVSQARLQVRKRVSTIYKTNG